MKIFSIFCLLTFSTSVLAIDTKDVFNPSTMINAPKKLKKKVYLC